MPSIYETAIPGSEKIMHYTLYSFVNSALDISSQETKAPNIHRHFIKKNKKDL